MRVKRVLQKNEDVKEKIFVDLSLIDSLLEKYKSKKGNLIPILQGTQNIYGYIPEDAFIKIAEVTGLKLADMYGVATFYTQFRLHPVGKHIVKVCHGTACHVQNATAISEAIEDALEIKDGETTPDRLFTLESVACLGCCSLAPVMMIGDNTFGKLTGSQAVKILKEIKIKENN
ncbi:MAG: NADH dehydrogenase [Bacteroidetes bacterium GWC2_33_15]|nr:MAG: NADH dehydrogenase [Bacteroidetes bacterium GWA2_33_15]OFX52152.1 MAG: NADH dehydrogenase [Bacteroidetes bacterium GWC2_33_15]OFX64306.1 MAG: NADH dehydrogenase [Bacteroidetes bacterium GWB2_32_14]OFX67711.1 MAG: NADH dehydrogenase [Bacteroidetes bacterium GWD2_33_33]HAN19321.1 NADH-quinone oxidoreductase subunit NuoE [Bacteroidales bacterium]